MFKIPPIAPERLPALLRVIPKAELHFHQCLHRLFLVRFLAVATDPASCT